MLQQSQRPPVPVGERAAGRLGWSPPRGDAHGRVLTGRNTVRLSIATGAYDAFEPLRNGDIHVPDVELVWVTENDPPVLFTKVIQEQSFDIAEMSLSQYFRRYGSPAFGYTAIPVFPLRMFRHGYVVVSEKSGIEEPGGLTGAVVGVPDFWQTAAVWVRGIMRDEYGVDWSRCRWVQAGMDGPRSADILGEVVRMNGGLSDRIQSLEVVADESLDSLISRGAVDVTIGARAPVSALTTGLAHPLFPDPQRVEEEWYARTGVFPIMHTLVVRNSLLEEQPDLAAALTRAMDEAAQIKWDRLLFSGANPTMLPWGYQAAVAAARLFAGNPWRHGLDRNRLALERFLKYLRDDGHDAVNDVDAYFRA